MPRQPVEPGFGVLHGVDVILQHDLLRRMGKAHRRQPAAVGQGPGPSPSVDLIMVAPSLIPKKAGDRVKTDGRDALMLAKLHHAGELTPIWIPDAAHEAMRDLVRARATAGRVLSKARQHLQGFLLRPGGSQLSIRRRMTAISSSSSNPIY